MLATLMIPAAVLVVPQYVTVSGPAAAAPEPDRFASGPVSGGLLSPDTAAWLRTVRR